MKVSIIIVKFLFIGALLIISNYNLHLGDQLERDTFFGMYTGWLTSLFQQGIDVTGYVVGFQWMPGANETQGISGMPQG